MLIETITMFSFFGIIGYGLWHVTKKLTDKNNKL